MHVNDKIECKYYFHPFTCSAHMNFYYFYFRANYAHLHIVISKINRVFQFSRNFPVFLWKPEDGGGIEFNAFPAL